MMNKNIIKNAKVIVVEGMAKYGPSHDFSHVMRVFNNAMKIYEADFKNDKNIDLLAVQLGALFHDLLDYKYEGENKDSEEILKKFMIDNKISKSTESKIYDIIKYSGFSNELSGGKKLDFWELKIIQDADKLDAIGSIGIARSFVYGGEKKIKIFDESVEKKINMTKDEYKKFQEEPEKHFTVYNHFYEKLLTLKGYMRTETGQKLAEKRHNFMLKFLEEFDEDILLK